MIDNSHNRYFLAYGNPAKFLCVFWAATFAVSFCPMVNAEVMLEPKFVGTDMGELRSPLGEHFLQGSNLTNQSGLSLKYESLTDDIDQYLSKIPTATHGHGANVWGSALGVRAGTIDFSLGETYAVRSLVLWSLGDDPSAIRTFKLFSDIANDFLSPSFLGEFTASNDNGDIPHAEPQQFRFESVNASYMRIEVLNTWSDQSNGTGLNEVAFGVVPEPSSYHAFAVVLIVCCCSWRRRRKHNFSV